MSPSTDPKPTTAEDPSADSPLIAKLKKHKAAHTGRKSKVLSQTGIEVTWPAFQPHSMWMRAQRLSKKNPMTTADIYCALVCKFDGENMTLDEFAELIPTSDALDLIGEVLGDDADDEVGNVLN